VKLQHHASQHISRHPDHAAASPLQSSFVPSEQQVDWQRAVQAVLAAQRAVQVAVPLQQLAVHVTVQKQ